MEKLQPITPEFAYERLRKVPNTTLSIQNRTDPQTAFAQTTVTRGNFIALCTAGRLVFQADDEKHELFPGDVALIPAGKHLQLVTSEWFKGQFLHLEAPKPLPPLPDFKRYDAIFLRFVESVEKYLYAPIGFYASTLGCPLVDLNWYCRRNSGMTARPWLTRYLLLEAKHLLAQDLKIREVARRLHFTQASHFSVWFTRLTKKTPYAWEHGYNYHSGE